jgi:hypothetical protein
MREFDDAALEARLRQVLTRRLGPLRLDLTAEDLEARMAARKRARARRRPWIVLGLAAALLLPAGWLAAGAPLPGPKPPSVALETPDPSNGPATPTPAPTAPASTEPVAVTASGAYQAIAIRPNGPDLDVLAIRADGEERLIKRLTTSAMPDGFVPEATGLISLDGWLAVGDRTGARSALIDLADPSAPIRTIDGWPEPGSMAWGPDGRIAVRRPQQTMVFDPVTGDTKEIRTAFGDNRVAWAADGSGFVAATGSPLKLTQPGFWPDWQVQRIATGAIEPGFVPTFDPWRGRKASGSNGSGSSAAGDRLVLCQPGVHALGTCRASAGYELGRQDAAGALTIWSVAPTGGFVDDVEFANDRGVWLLSHHSIPTRFDLERLDEQGRHVRGVTTPIRAAAADSTSSAPAQVRLGQMAPDDSLAQIEASYDDPDITDWFLLPTDGIPGTYHRGGFAGYLGSSVADALGGGPFALVPGVEAPEVSRAPKLPSDGELDRFARQTSNVSNVNPVLLRADDTTSGVIAVTQPAGHRLAVQFACAGPGTMELAVADQSYGSECMGDDQSQNGFTVASVESELTLLLDVTVPSGTAWRLAVYDLGP